MNPDDLRAIVEKATPGPWCVESGDDYYVCADGYPTIVKGRFPKDDIGELAIIGNRTDDYGEANAAHIAAFNPSTCLALLDELDGLKARVESAEKVLRQADAAISRAHAETRSMEDADLFEQVRIAASAHFTKHPEGKI